MLADSNTCKYMYTTTKCIVDYITLECLVCLRPFECHMLENLVCPETLLIQTKLFNFRCNTLKMYGTFGGLVVKMYSTFGGLVV